MMKATNQHNIFIQILKSDIISKKICQKCYKNTKKIYEIRQTAHQQDKHLKEKCQQFLGDKGIRLPNTSVTIKKDNCQPCQTERQKIQVSNDTASVSSETSDNKDQIKQTELNVKSCTSLRTVNSIKGIHFSIIDVYRKYPHFKLPKKCLERHIAPIVSLTMGDVESHFKKCKLDMAKYIYKPNVYKPIIKKIPTLLKTVTPLKIHRSSHNNERIDENTSMWFASSNRSNNTQEINASQSDKMPTQQNIASTVIDKNVSQKVGDPKQQNRSITSQRRRPGPKSRTHQHNVSQEDSLNAVINKSTNDKVGEYKQQNSITTKSLRLSPRSKTVKNNESSDCNLASPGLPQNHNETSCPKFQSSNNVCSLSTSSVISPRQKVTEVANKNSADCSPVPTETNDTRISQVPESPSKNNAKRKFVSTDIFRNPKTMKHLQNHKTSNLSKTSTIIVIDNTEAATSEVQIPTSDVSKISPLESTDTFVETKSTAEGPLHHINTSKPEFIQSLGLTPAVASHLSLNILVCKICNSVHPNVGALKKHSSRHRVCPFCKVKFKSVERKQIHIDESCEVKGIIESPQPFVRLERIDFNVELRQQYKNTFAAVGIEELQVPDIENKSTSKEAVPYEVIVLSDDEEPRLDATDNDVSVSLEDTPMPGTSQMESVSVVRPIVSIYNNTTLNEIGYNSSDRQVIKELLHLLQKAVTSGESSIQTELPPYEDLTIINKNDTFRLKNLKGILLSNVIPITVNGGMDFRVSYNTTKKDVSKKNDKSGDWRDLPIIDKRTINTSQEIPIMNTTYPLTFVTSQGQPPQLSLSSIQLMTATPTMSIFLPGTSAFIPNAGLSIQPSINNTVNQTQTINNTYYGSITNSSIQTTPLLQNFSLGMGPLPIINNQVSVQTTNNETRPHSTAASPAVSKLVTKKPAAASESGSSSSKKSLSASFPKSKKLSISSRKKKLTGGKILSKKKRQLIKVKIGNLASTASSKSSKLRVKNIWELK